MEILYISSAPSPQEFKRVRAAFYGETPYGMDEAGMRFHTLILEGLCAHSGVHIHALVYRAVGWRSHKGLIWKNMRERISDQLEYEHLGLINLPVLKQLGLGIGLFFRMLTWAVRTAGRERAVFLDGSGVATLPFLMLAKRIAHCPATAVFCDIYEYMANVKDAMEHERTPLLYRVFRWITARCYNELDGFVLLTEAMRDVVNKENRPYIVMEGLADIHSETARDGLEETREFIVMYAGALREQYGLKNLIDGFLAYENAAVKLWIYGDGSYADTIRRASRMDKRIFFGGAVTQEEILQKEQMVSLLVNPRPVHQEFTKYSFPSKNIEYMASGTPLLTTKLPGMPQEYYDYVFTIDSDTPEGVTQALQKILSLPREELRQKGLAAREFVQNKKNNVIQAGRILQLLKQISRKETCV